VFSHRASWKDVLFISQQLREGPSLPGLIYPISSRIYIPVRVDVVINDFKTCVRSNESEMCFVELAVSKTQNKQTTKAASIRSLVKGKLTQNDHQYNQIRIGNIKVIYRSHNLQKLSNLPSNILVFFVILKTATLVLTQNDI